MSVSRPAVLDQPLGCLFEDPTLPAYRTPQALVELYRTVAPRLVGPAGQRSSRKSLVEGADVLGKPGAEGRLLSVRMHRSDLFLRYRLGEVNDNE